MLFNSYVFIFIFLPVTFIVWRSLCAKKKTTAAIYWLLSASLFFYGYWNPPYLLLLLASIAVNFTIQRMIAKTAPSRTAKLWLTAGVVMNLALIGYYKYADFFASNIALMTGTPWRHIEIFLPLGISFFTFQQIACLADTYHGKLGIIPFRHYALFVSFFPQLIAGPIVLADKIIPQFSDKKIFCLSWKNICLGLTLFSIGLFKKVIIADTFSPWTALAFDAQHPLTLLEAWGGALSYTVQLYFDFSGYSDMALGLASFFNIKLPLNFNSPYKARSIIDFWRRWHMTLSAFLRDYLYIPLGGNRKGKTRRYVNLMITMLLGGLWHGAGWTFVIWGGLHGLYLTANHLWREHSPVRLPSFFGWLLTFLSVVVAWVFFRAESASQAIEILKGMAGMNGFVVPSDYVPGWLASILPSLGVSVLDYTPMWAFERREIINITLAVLVCAIAPNAYEITSRVNFTRRQWLTAAAACALALTASLSMYQVSEFLYFQF